MRSLGTQRGSKDGAEAGRDESFGISSKSVSLMAVNNLAYNIQTSSRHPVRDPIRDLPPSFGKEKDAMKQKDAANPIFIHTPGQQGA